MHETYRMLGREHEADLAREADRRRLADRARARSRSTPAAPGEPRRSRRLLRVFARPGWGASGAR